ncbi:hypothetical protein F511_29553 [Dorcoceras hygrometricum]|uniref:Uncharacterized protein n=1 Tax=Dorcoceras hygrometricum TaxID=472368 RepID=A0A2Z7DJY8_9LAMI|nr:hypothetical protein F511_29553 [Dorcoceras hygrometricum]
MMEPRRGPDSENDYRQPLKCRFPREIGRSQAPRRQQDIQTYIATNETIDARGKSDESGVIKVASVKKKFVHKKESAPTDDEPALLVAEKAVSKNRPATEADVPVVKKKKRTLKGKAAPSKDNMELVTVAQEAVPLQTIDPSSAVPAERAAVEKTVSEREIEISVDTVDQIIEQILADTKQFEMGEELETYMGDQGLTDVGEQMETGQDAYFVEEPVEETVSHAGPLGSLGLYGAGEHDNVDDITPTGGEDVCSACGLVTL